MQKNQQVALITGAPKRIGAAIARLLHAQGMNVIVHYNTSKILAEKLCAELNQARTESAVALPADLCATVQLEKLVLDAVNIWGRLDVLVNNASSFYRTKIGETTLAAWEGMLSCNLTAPFFLTQAAAVYLKKQQGSVVNIADVHGHRPMREYAAYCVSKAGLIMLTKAFAKELAPAVRVNALALGPTVPPEGANELSTAVQQKIIERTPLQRVGNVEDVARAVWFLISGAGYITGQVLAVDGGRSLMI
ncbi:MAG: pteridine reductase [Pseudomonadota bacterium]